MDVMILYELTILSQNTIGADDVHIFIHVMFESENVMNIRVWVFEVS